MNNIQNFVRLVARMRQAQKKAKQLKAKSYIDLAESLERDVDKQIEEMTLEGTKIKQLKLEAAAEETGGGNG